MSKRRVFIGSVFRVDTLCKYLYVPAWVTKFTYRHIGPYRMCLHGSREKMQKNSVPVSEVMAARIRRRLAELGMSRADLAAAAGVSDRLVYKTMQANAVVRATSIGKIAKTLDCDLEYLLGETDHLHDSGRVVRERAETYASENAEPEPFSTVVKAIRFLAEQFGVDAPGLRMCLLEYVMKHGREKGEQL